MSAGARIAAALGPQGLSKIANGNLNDVQIKALQAQGGAGNADAINRLRSQGVDVEQALGGKTYNFSGGGSGVSEEAIRPTAGGEEFGQISDPIAQIAARIGQLRGQYAFNRGNPAHNESNDQAAMNAEIAPLQDVLETYKKKQDLETQMAEMQKRQSENSRPTHGGGMMGPDPSEQQRYLPRPYNAPGAQGDDRTDPNHPIHDAARRQLLAYLRINQPHLFSSLNKG